MFNIELTHLHWWYNSLKYTTHKTAKNAAIFHTFFYVSNNFLTDFHSKILSVSCVVCKGLKIHHFTMMQNGSTECTILISLHKAIAHKCWA